MIRYLLAYLLFATSPTSHSALVTLYENESLNITFSLPGVPPTYFGLYDILGLAFETEGFASTAFSTSAALFNGVTFLGTNVSNNQESYWVSASSQFNIYAPTVVDFTSLLDGSIEGHIDVTTNGGAITFDPDRLHLNFGQAMSSNSWRTEGGTLPIINSVAIQAVPSPPTYLLLISGVLALGAVGRYGSCAAKKSNQKKAAPMPSPVFTGCPCAA
jgi:hypothetical protein